METVVSILIFIGAMFVMSKLGLGCCGGHSKNNGTKSCCSSKKKDTEK
jgi:hypothetical protein